MKIQIKIFKFNDNYFHIFSKHECGKIYIGLCYDDEVIRELTHTVGNETKIANKSTNMLRRVYKRGTV
jgi:hypothetical protein